MRPEALVGLPVLLCQHPHFRQCVEDLAVATDPSASCRQVLSTLLWFTLQPLRLRRPVGAVLRRRGNQVCNRLDVSGDGNGLSMLDLPVEFGQAHLGLRSLNLTHVDSNLLFWPHHSIYCSLPRSTTDVGTPPLNQKERLGLDNVAPCRL